MGGCIVVPPPPKKKSTSWGPVPKFASPRPPPRVHTRCRLSSGGLPAQRGPPLSSWGGVCVRPACASCVPPPRCHLPAVTPRIPCCLPGFAPGARGVPKWQRGHRSLTSQRRGGPSTPKPPPPRGENLGRALSSPPPDPAGRLPPRRHLATLRGTPVTKRCRGRAHPRRLQAGAEGSRGGV